MTDVLTRKDLERARELDRSPYKATRLTCEDCGAESPKYPVWLVGGRWLCQGCIVGPGKEDE